MKNLNSLTYIVLLFLTSCTIAKSIVNKGCDSTIVYALYDPDENDFEESSVYQNIFHNELYVNKKNNSKTLENFSSNGAIYKLEIFNCYGSAIMKTYDENGRLKVSGNFKGYNKLLTMYDAVAVYPGDTVEIDTFDFYLPLKHGEWQVYDTLGNIVKTYFFNNGYLTSNVGKESDLGDVSDQDIDW